MPINPSGTRAASFEDILIQLHQLSTDDVAYDSSEIVNLLLALTEAAKGVPLWRLSLTGTSFQWGSFPNPQSTGSAMGPYMFGPRRMGRPLMAGVTGAGASYLRGQWGLALWS